MKKLKLKRSKKATGEAPSRITNETVAEHREEILAGGRKFKYPRQYARHKLVFNALLIIIVTIIALALISWWQLYSVQNTGSFFYRVTRLVPVPVASVDGAQVRYSDYLMSLSGSQHYLEQTERLNLDSEDGKRQIDYIKRQALEGAIADTYAAKVAKEKNISVSEKQVDEVINSSLNTVSGRISQDVYDDSTLSTLGYSASEYRHIIHDSLLRQEVSYSIDTKATDAKESAEEILVKNSKASLTKIADELKKKGYDVQLGNSGLVPKTNHDGGLTQEAMKLKQSELSSFFRSTTGDGHYIVQLVESNDSQVNYSFLKIPLTMFEEKIRELRQNNKIQEYISIKKNGSEVIRQK